MPRWISPLAATLFALVLCAPSLMVVQFQVRRAYIERELCVQREVMASMRTCHGECHLSRKFKALEREAQAGYPSERMEVRLEPRIVMDTEVAVVELASSYRFFPACDKPLADGHTGESDPVPRS